MNDSRKLCDKCHRLLSKANFDRHICVDEADVSEIRQLYANGTSLKQIREKYSKSLIRIALLKQRRSMSEAIKLAHEQYSSWHGHIVSQETRQKLRQAQISEFKQEDVERVRRLYIDGLSLREVSEIEKNDSLVKFALKGLTRNYADAGKLAHIKKPDSFKHSVQTRHALSVKMKLAHQEGRAWNIGKSRWNTEKSYPEKFFEKVIQNEFNDKQYKCEFPVGIYAMDFAWVHKKKAIEIDGQQHQRFEEYRDRDKRKDEFVQNEGWTILRLVWRDVFKNTKYWIRVANEFIGN
jgi:very-short-patch-repair endonuclease